MRRIVAFNNVSADGYFAAPDGNLNWVVPDPEMDRFAAEAIRRGGTDTILFGRKTYQMFASFWPNVLDQSGMVPDPHTGGQKSADLHAMAVMLNEAQKIVFSKTLREAKWKNSSIVRELDPDAIARMKRQPGQDLMIFGSGTIVSLLTRHRLIDQYQFVVSPVLLGGGRNLLSGVPVNHRLELKEEKRFPSGKILARYELAQAVTTAETAAETPAVAKKEVRKARARPAKSAAVALLQPDAALSKIVGGEAMSRSEVTKKLWSYIKRKGLQDKRNRRMINADDGLRPVLGVKSQVDILELPELVDKHLKAKK